jgi:hypothetical protein
MRMPHALRRRDETLTTSTFGLSRHTPLQPHIIFDRDAFLIFSRLVGTRVLGTNHVGDEVECKL